MDGPFISILSFMCCGIFNTMLVVLSSKTLPEQLEPTPYVGAGNTRSSVEQVEKTCEEEEVKKRIPTRQHQGKSTC